MPDRRFSSLRRSTLREGVTFAIAAAGVVAVAASSAVSVADDSVPSRIAMVAEVHKAAAPAAEVAAPAPLPLPIPVPIPEPTPAPAPAYPDNLDGWIHQALDIMQSNNIPGSYDGIHRNVMRESTGNPHAINLWDSNAAAGIPSKGLLQVIDPTFRAYHVEGTSWDIYDPVANIAAACNYAARTYGSMDNVNSAY
ncbi:transglycosylase SLT domain-containing protein [Nocardia sp. NPDC051052]|uniref:transglycosylase SLT domain-containing protein n=1 Tax=Nocardia sp. NPDC051052 TaxID=3364322 RepID=UPI00379A6232